jgi:integrase-like protein
MLGSIPLQKLDGKAIDRFYAHLRKADRRHGGGLASVSLHNVHRMLSQLLKSAVKAKLIARSPIDDVQTKTKRLQLDLGKDSADLVFTSTEGEMQPDRALCNLRPSSSSYRCQEDQVSRLTASAYNPPSQKRRAGACRIGSRRTRSALRHARYIFAFARC